MITDKGKSILSKFLIGQAPAYASYIAVGCGAVPLKTSDSFGSYAAKETLDFEMFRVPVISKGYVTETINGSQVSKIVLTAQLPTEERYEISELGLYPASTNPVAQSNDSKNLMLFNLNEEWEYHETGDDQSVYLIPQITSRLDSTFNGTIDVKTTVVPDDVPDGYVTYDNAFRAGSDNVTFDAQPRVARLERPRVLNESIILRGNISDLTVSNGHLAIGSTSNHIHINMDQTGLTKNSAIDQIKTAFSIINKNATDDPPDAVRLIVEFANEDHPGSVAPDRFARIEINITHSETAPDNITSFNLKKNRYIVDTKLIKDLYRSSTSFTWSDASIVRIFASAIKDGAPSSNYYIALDGVRVENIASVSPIYGLTGYTVIKNTNPDTGTTPLTVSKKSNTSNFVEFRFVVDVTP